MLVAHVALGRGWYCLVPGDILFWCMNRCIDLGGSVECDDWNNRIWRCSALDE